jgi:hypothetical protein
VQSQLNHHEVKPPHHHYQQRQQSIFPRHTLPLSLLEFL